MVACLTMVVAMAATMTMSMATIKTMTLIMPMTLPKHSQAHDQGHNCHDHRPIFPELSYGGFAIIL